MNYGIFLNTVLPVRSEAKESSEMVTQLLFGEICIVLESKNSFIKIETYYDKYQGWVDKKMLCELSEETYKRLLHYPTFRSNVPIADIFCSTENSYYRISLGSLLPFFDDKKNEFKIIGKTFQIHSSFATQISTNCKEKIISTATLFLNTPYLWGGKNILGIDCSGLVQMVFSINGYNLPRDASIQEKEGDKISSLIEAKATDLLFFEKDDKITHVGIYLGGNKIIHASGKVRIDSIDEFGIYNDDLSEYTHKLSSIKRI